MRTALVVLAAVSLLAAGASTAVADPAAGMEQYATPTPAPLKDGTTLEYTDESSGVKLRYPKDWTTVSGVDGIVVGFLAPSVDPWDSFLANVNVIVEDLSYDPMTLDEYADYGLYQLDLAGFYVPHMEETMVAGCPAYRVLYEAYDETMGLKWLQVWTVRDNRAYVITYTAKQDQFRDHLSDVENMIESFEIASNAPELRQLTTPSPSTYAQTIIGSETAGQLPLGAIAGGVIGLVALGTTGYAWRRRTANARISKLRGEIVRDIETELDRNGRE